MSAGIACARVCSQISRSNVRLHIGRPVRQQNARPVPTVAAHSFVAVASHDSSKPTAAKNLPSPEAMVTARTVAKAFFPLDNELALLPGRLTPLLQDHLAHLGAWMPFAKAAALLECFTHTQVSESSAQRLTEAIGMAYEAVQLAEVERIEQDWPEVEAGPDKLVLSVDGAFVPVLHGQWAEVKTLVVGEVGEAMLVDGQSV